MLERILGVVLLACVAGAARADTVVPLKVHEGLDTLYVGIDVAGTRVENYLVDTGAGFMTITDSTLERLQEAGTATYVGELDGRMADGSQLRVPVYRLSEIVVGGACRLQDVEAAVLPGASRGLFGLSALRKAAPFGVSLDPPRLRLANCVAKATAEATGR